MSQFIKFYFTFSMLNMFRTLIYPPSGACDCAVELPHWSFCSVKMEDPDDGYINVRNMLSIEEEKNKT